GHAFSVHGLSGSLGWAAAPLTITALSQLFGWRGALFTVGSAGLILFGVLYASRRFLATTAELDGNAALAGTAGARRSQSGALRPLLTTPVLLCFGYFLLIALALTGLQSFAIPALMDFS